MDKKNQNWFTYTGAVLLFIVAVPILLAAKSRTEALTLQINDPILFVTNRQVLYLVGGIELFLSAFLLLIKKSNIKLFLTGWLTANLLVYQGALWFSKADSIGSLANLTNKLPVKPEMFDRVTLIILGWLLIGSFTFLVLDWLSSRRRIAHVKSSEPDKHEEGT